MSTLLIDMGNSHLKWALASGNGELSHLHNIPLDSSLDASWDGCETPERILISCVGSEQHKSTLKDIFETKWQLSPEFLTSPAKGSGITNAYEEPARLGSDRWAAMVAAYHVTRTAVLVVDAGTALTIDAIDDQGRHLGGLISPGLGLTRKALVTGTQMELKASDTDVMTADFFGRSTEQGIASGTVHAMGCLIDRAFNQVREHLSVTETSAGPACYLTGGDAEQIKNTLQCPYVLEPTLVLKGLALIATAP